MKKVIYVVIFLYATVGFSQTRWDFALTVKIDMDVCVDTSASHLIAKLNEREEQKNTRIYFMGWYGSYFRSHKDSITYTSKTYKGRIGKSPIISKVQKVKVIQDTLQFADGSKFIIMGKNQSYICLYGKAQGSYIYLYENSAIHQLSIWDIKEMIVLFKNRFHPEMVFCK